MPPRFTPGQLTVAQASALNDIATRLDALGRMSVSAPLSIVKNAGVPAISMPYGFPVLAKVTGNDGGTPPVYTAIRETRGTYAGTDLNEVIDYVPETVYDKCLSALTDEPLNVDDVVMLFEVQDFRGWFWAVPVPDNAEYRPYCDPSTSTLVWQESTDGGTTWTTVADLGVACVPDSGSGSGSGGGSGSGSGPQPPAPPCTACIPSSDDPPTAGDPYVQTDTQCYEGVLYVVREYQRLVWDATNNKPVIEYYGGDVYIEGCCDCGGSGPGSTENLCPGPALTLSADCTAVSEPWPTPEEVDCPTGATCDESDVVDEYALNYCVTQTDVTTWRTFGYPGASGDYSLRVCLSPDAAEAVTVNLFKDVCSDAIGAVVLSPGECHCFAWAQPGSAPTRYNLSITATTVVQVYSFQMFDGLLCS